MPDIPKCVAILAPHTSNFDLPLSVALMFGLDPRMSWRANTRSSGGPSGTLLRWLGGFPVDRRAATDVVAQAANLIRWTPRIFSGIAPEGTRTRVGKWKTGFHRIATQAEVPIVTVALDYPNRRAMIGAAFEPTGDLESD